MQSRPGLTSCRRIIPLCEPKIGGNEWKYIKQCLDTGWVSSAGSFVERFEEQLASYVGVKHAVATISGTAALHVALLASGVRPDDEVLLPALTFIAPANAIRYVGAWPVLIDVEADYWQLDPQKVLDFLRHKCRWVNGEMHNKTTGRRVKGIIPVHILGHTVDMDPILEIAHKYSLVVIEDATESLGARYKGRMVGTLGDMACFSFNGNKIVTTGSGGMIVTNNKRWAMRARYLTTQAKDNPVEYIHNEIGYNYRLTNIQAAMGVAQLEQIDIHLAEKRRIASVYTSALQNVPGIFPMREATWASSTFWMYTVLVDETLYGLDSRELLRRLAETGIQTRPLWQPLNQGPVHAASGVGTYSVSDALYRKALSLPCSVGLPPVQQETVISNIHSCYAST